MEATGELKALFMVVNAGFAEEVFNIAREAGVKGATILNARGEGHHHERFLGITVDTEREVVLTITDSDTAEKTMAAVKANAGIKTPAHCVCFTMPVSDVVGLVTG